MRIIKAHDIIRSKDVKLEVSETDEFTYGQKVLVKGPKEELVCRVSELPRDVPGLKASEDFKLKRKLTDEEVKKFEESQKGTQDRVKNAQAMADSLKLKMRFFDARVGWKGQMISFLFTSEHPVDFRDLLKKMVQGFSGRIHLERVSPRERARIMGGVGTCGRTNCCQFLGFNHQKVSLDAVRDQGIMINNNSKIFGVHGKIKTCYLYELDQYRKNRKYLPHIKQEVRVGKEKGRVIGLDILNRKVKLIMGNDTIEVFDVAKVDYENKKEAPEDLPLSFEEYEVEIEGVGIEK